jgi:hypothetical protein
LEAWRHGGAAATAVADLTTQTAGKVAGGDNANLANAESNRKWRREGRMQLRSLICSGLLDMGRRHHTYLEHV